MKCYIKTLTHPKYPDAIIHGDLKYKHFIQHVRNIHNYLLHNKIKRIGICIPSSIISLEWIIACFLSHTHIFVYNVYDLCNIEPICHTYNLQVMITTESYVKQNITFMKTIDTIILIDNIDNCADIKTILYTNIIDSLDSSPDFIEHARKSNKWYTLVSNHHIVTIDHSHTSHEFNYLYKNIKCKGKSCIVLYPVYLLYMIPILFIYISKGKTLYFYDSIHKRQYSHGIMLHNDPLLNHIDITTKQSIIDIDAPTYPTLSKNTWLYSSSYGKFVSFHNTTKIFGALSYCTIYNRLENIKKISNTVYKLKPSSKIFVHNKHIIPIRIHQVSEFRIHYYKNHSFKASRSKYVVLSIFCFFKKYNIQLHHNKIIQHIYDEAPNTILKYLQKVSKFKIVFHYIHQHIYIYIHYPVYFSAIFKDFIIEITQLYQTLLDQKDIYISRQSNKVIQQPHVTCFTNILQWKIIFNYIFLIIIEFFYTYGIKFVYTHIYKQIKPILNNRRITFPMHSIYMKYCVENYLPIHIPFIVVIMSEIVQHSNKNIIFLEMEDEKLLYPKIKRIQNKNTLENLLADSQDVENWWSSKSKLLYFKTIYNCIHISSCYQTIIKYIGNFKESIIYDITTPSNQNYVSFYIMNDSITFEWNLEHEFDIAKRLNKFFKKDIFINSR